MTLPATAKAHPEEHAWRHLPILTEYRFRAALAMRGLGHELPASGYVESNDGLRKLRSTALDLEETYCPFMCMIVMPDSGFMVPS